MASPIQKQRGLPSPVRPRFGLVLIRDHLTWLLSFSDTVGERVVECDPIHQYPLPGLVMQITSRSGLFLLPVLAGIHAHDDGVVLRVRGFDDQRLDYRLPVTKAE